MRFYIFGSDKSQLKTKAKKAYFVTGNIEEAAAKFKYAVESIRYHHLYLVVDFEHVHFPLFKRVSINDGYDELPFFIVGEWHISDTFDKYIRTDHTIVTIKGVEAHFENNLKALRHVINMYKAGTRDIKFEVVYGEFVEAEGIDTERRIVRTIVDFSNPDTYAVISGIRNIVLDKLMWVKCPIK